MKGAEVLICSSNQFVGAKCCVAFTYMAYGPIYSHGAAEMRSCAYLEPGREEEAGGMAKHTRRAWGMDVGIERERDAMKCIGF